MGSRIGTRLKASPYLLYNTLVLYLYLFVLGFIPISSFGVPFVKL